MTRKLWISTLLGILPLVALLLFPVEWIPEAAPQPAAGATVPAPHIRIVTTETGFQIIQDADDDASGVAVDLSAGDRGLTATLTLTQTAHHRALDAFGVPARTPIALSP